MTVRMFLTGQHVMVPDRNAPGHGAMIEAVVITSNPRTTHYQTATYKGWTYTPRVKTINPTGDTQ